MVLTDAVSIERGIGPICSRKGYLEEPKETDEMQAFIELSPFPDLVEYMTRKYKPGGARSLMNGLVRIASLNRKSPYLHSSICNAIEALGYRNLASTLRECISMVEIRDAKENPDFFAVWVRREMSTREWFLDLRAACNLQYGERLRKANGNKGFLVPKSAKMGLWKAILRHFPGEIVKVPSGGTVKAVRKQP
jgi:hypothetical protein